jgi:NADH-quinone oxidoreductase subunit I
MRIYGYGILRSMQLAFRNFMRKPITVQYPHEKLVLPERARWAVAQRFDEDGNHRCTACLACERACPDYVIKIDVTTGEDRSKHIDRWHYEEAACMMCGLCVEACTFDAIYMSHDYELARINFADLEIDLLLDTPAAKPKKKAPAAPAAHAAPAASPAADAAPAPAPADAAPAPAPADAAAPAPAPSQEGEADA